MEELKELRTRKEELDEILELKLKEERFKRFHLDRALADVLKDFSLSGIKRCKREDCERWFFQPGKKEKRFCSNRCALIVNKRKKRGGLKRKKLPSKEE